MGGICPKCGSNKVRWKGCACSSKIIKCENPECGFVGNKRFFLGDKLPSQKQGDDNK